MLETSSCQVIDWLDRHKADYAILTGEDLQHELQYEISLTGEPGKATLEIPGKNLVPEQVHVVWFRRPGLIDLSAVDRLQPPELRNGATEYLRDEVRAMRKSLYSVFRHAVWVNHPDNVLPNKFAALQIAADQGLDIPKTIITNSQRRVAAFKQNRGRIITKNIQDATFFQVSGDVFAPFTIELDDEKIRQIPARCFPILCQEFIEKLFDLRVFFLGGETFPMAIFSQDNDRTSVDFRRYDLKKPNRTGPVRLPEDLVKKIRGFMKAMDMATGSLDFVKDKDGRHVFLEVNPVGQFGMVSGPCNFQIERKLAEYLMTLDGQGISRAS